MNTSSPQTDAGQCLPRGQDPRGFRVPHRGPPRNRHFRGETSVTSTVLLAWMLAACIQCFAASRTPIGRVIVDAGAYDRIDSVVSLPLSGVAISTSARPHLEEERGAEVVAVPSQLDQGTPPILWWTLTGKTPAGSSRVFRLSESNEKPAAVVTFRKDDTAATLRLGEHRVLQYNHAVVPPPPGASPRFRRSGFIHPLWSPSGVELTRIHPRDHIHHLGLWAPWTKTTFEGEHIDFWNLNAGQGTVRFVRFTDRVSGPIYGGFGALQEHAQLRGTNEERIVLNESLDVRVWSAGSAESGSCLVDYTSVLSCATESPLTLEAYRYGGFGFRGTALWEHSNSDYLTSEGRTRLDGDGTRARWCDVYGNTGQNVEGALFLSHPNNREHPEPMRIWPSDSNGGRGDVFFNFCPIRNNAWVLEPGQQYTLRYRLWIHSGKTTPSNAERLWNDFADPPRARLIRNQSLNAN